MADRIKKTLALSILAICFCSVSARSPLDQGQTPKDNPLSNWRPTRDHSGINYVGSNACARCHSKQAATQLATPMARAIELTADCQVLSARPRMTFRNGPYLYQITRQGKSSIYSVSDGVNTISEPILYCFGQGLVGQTYIFQHRGSFFESRVSYYRELDNLDITMEHPRSVPASLEDALGRPMSPEAARGCFACHSTGAVRGHQLQLEKMSPGVTCEACHGPGERHLSAVKAGRYNDLQIFNPRGLDAFDQMQEFCGACHQSFDTVMLLPDRGGINNVRFQPYRMFNSRAHFINDHRLSCVACHDPHGEMVREAQYYDSKCFACHLSSPGEVRTKTRAASACPVSKQQCVTCHMPKVEVPDMHFKFTDHWIRIARPNDRVPN